MSRFAIGRRINLERALQAGGRLGTGQAALRIDAELGERVDRAPVPLILRRSILWAKPMLRAMTGIFLLALVALAAGENDAVVGKWALTATDVNGSDTVWTLLVKEEGGKLAGTLGNAEGASFRSAECFD